MRKWDEKRQRKKRTFVGRRVVYERQKVGVVGWRRCKKVGGVMKKRDGGEGAVESKKCRVL
jgi:hypothetical protein